MNFDKNNKNYLEAKKAKLEMEKEIDSFFSKHFNNEGNKDFLNTQKTHINQLKVNDNDVNKKVDMKKPVVIIKRNVTTITEAKPVTKKPVVRIISVEEQQKMKLDAEKEKEENLKKQNEKEITFFDFDAPPTIEQINRSSVNITPSKTKMIDTTLLQSDDVENTNVSNDKKDSLNKVLDNISMENEEGDNFYKSDITKPIILNNNDSSVENNDISDLIVHINADVNSPRKYVFESMILDSIDKKIETMSFKSKILKKLNLVVKEKDLVVIFGNANSGKTTLLNIISNNEIFNSGEFIINDKYLGELPREEKRIFIKNNVFFLHKNFYFDNAEQVYFIFKNEYDKATNELKNIFTLQDIIDKFNLHEMMNKFFNELSKAEKQILLLVYAVIKEYQIILIDEPFLPDSKHDDYLFKNILRIINSIFKKTIIIASSNKRLFDLATKKYFLIKGTAKLIG